MNHKLLNRDLMQARSYNPQAYREKARSGLHTPANQQRTYPPYNGRQQEENTAHLYIHYRFCPLRHQTTESLRHYYRYEAW